MNKCREAFEKKFPIPAHWIEFDEKRNKYYCPYVADAKASEYQEMWEVWQSRQAEVVDKDQRIHELNETSLDLEGQIYKLQEQLNEKDKRIEELESALTQIKSWESHPKNYETNFGSWGLRDFYRDLADKALRGDHEA